MNWQQSRLQGGGFIAGLLQDPHQPHILYARSDVAGVFRSEDGGCSWKPCNNGMTAYHQHDVRSFAISPHDSRILFRGTGSVRGGDFFGFIHRSTDGGTSWHQVSETVDFYGNGELRQYGEVIQVDPYHPSRVIAGGYTKGVWISHDLGETWTYSGLKDERICTVAYHPACPNVIYVGTVGSFDDDPLFVAQQYDYVRPNPARLYRSRDGGESWETLCEGVDFAELAFDPSAPHVIHAACVSAGVMRSTDDGQTWRAASLSRYKIGTIAVDPRQPNTIYAAAETFPNFDPDVPPIGLYRSDDAGETWRLIKWHTSADLCNYPSYMELPYAGWAVAKIRVDVRDSRTLYLSNWYGVAVSSDGGETWDAHGYEGMENICVEHVAAHPAQANRVYLTAADHSPMVSADAGKTFSSMPRPKGTRTQPDSTAFIASKFDSTLIFYGIKGSGVGAIVKANTDGGDPRIVWQGEGTPDTEPSRLMFQSRAAAVSVQALVEDPFTAGTLYAYIDGLVACGAGVMRSTDWGETWHYLANPFPPQLTRVPHQREWIENELLSVVIAQTKNVCGTNQLMCADPFQAATLYIGEWTEGIFRSTDGGKSWDSIGQGLPFQREHASVLTVVRADPQRAGTLYAGFIREGVWRSEDRGASWVKLFPHDDTLFNASSLSVVGQTIAVVCEPLYYAPCASAVWVSKDSGTTWTNIYDPTLGAIRWKSAALTGDGATLYAGSCGNSVFYLSLE